MEIYDLSDPTKPVFIRKWGLPGQNPGSKYPAPIGALTHNIRELHGPQRNGLNTYRYGQEAFGIFVILDRDKLLNGPKEPTDENLQYPIIAKVDLPRDVGVHNGVPPAPDGRPRIRKATGRQQRKRLLLRRPENSGVMNAG